MYALVSFLKNFLYRRNFTNKVQVCRATLSRRRTALPDPKYDPDPESDPKQNIPDPQLWNFSDWQFSFCRVKITECQSFLFIPQYMYCTVASISTAVNLGP